jgi:ubiquinone/menaquinone biosynthesis C-methylase UbiE
MTSDRSDGLEWPSRSIARMDPTPRDSHAGERLADAIARLYDLDLSEDPGDVDLFRALARRTGSPIVELAVGTGRIAVPLAEDGHRVVGVDIDRAMLDRARTRIAGAGPDIAARVHLVEADLVDADSDAAVASGGPYALAILGLNSILLLATVAGQRGALATMARLLAPGGVAVVDAWQPSPADLVAFDGRISLEWLRTDPATSREVTKKLAAWYEHLRRLVTLTTLFEEGGPGESLSRWIRQDVLRLISADEMVAFAEAAGLEVEQVAGDYELGPLDPGSDRVVLIATKRN